MKKALTVLFSSLTVLAFSQAGYLNQTSRWKEHRDAFDFVNYHYERYEYFIPGDTVINSITYYKIQKVGYDSVVSGMTQSYLQTNQINTYYGAIREDIPNKKVFVQFPNSPEELLYDFNLNIGDTVPAMRGACSGGTIAVIDTVFFAGQPRRRWFMPNDTYYYYIEGIGANTGLFGSLCMTYETGSCLKKYDQSGNSLSIVNCSQVASGIKTPESTDELIPVFPNPTSGVLNFKRPTGLEVEEIRIINSCGKEVRTYSCTTSTVIDLENLPPGIYLAQFKTDKGFVTSKVTLIKD